MNELSENDANDSAPARAYISAFDALRAHEDGKSAFSADSLGYFSNVLKYAEEYFKRVSAARALRAMARAEMERRSIK